jgi:hypothetical protein
MPKRTRRTCTALIWGAALGAVATQAAEPPGPAPAAAAGRAVVCIALPAAQLGQGNNSPTDVSEPVRTTLGTFMAGPAVELVRLTARIPVQIQAEAAQLSCGYILQSSVTHKKGGGGLFKSLAPLAGALPMLGGMGAMGGMGGGMGGAMASSMAASAMSGMAASAAAQSMQQDMMAAMTGAQQSNVKKGDSITLEYALSAVGAAQPVKKAKLDRKAKQDGEDLLSPLLEQVASEVVTTVVAK